ncbi:MAG: hypothetical protein Q8880_12535, partial [Bacteroidota bacterium]|nr:hypothetical protein [Bacteroidota bacterium]
MTYQIVLTGSTIHNCTDSVKHNITVHPNPRADYSIKKSSGCAPFTIDDENININSLIAPSTTFNWTVYDKRHNIINSYTGVKFQSDTISKDADTVFIRLISTNTFGCKPDSNEKMFTTIENPKAIFSVGVDKGCSPMTIHVSNSSIPVNINSKWYLDNAIVSLSKDSAITINNTDNIKDKYSIVKLIVISNLTSCIDSMFKPITVYPNPKADFDFGTTNICSPAIVNVSNKSISVSNVKYKWDILKGSNVKISDSSAKEPVFSFPDNQTNSDSVYTTRLMVTSSDGCFDKTEREITIYKRPVSEFESDTISCSPIDLFPSNKSNTKYQSLWSINPANGVLFDKKNSYNPKISIPIDTSDKSIDYNIVLISETDKGCKDTSKRNIRIYPQPVIKFDVSKTEGCGPLDITFTNKSNPQNNEDISSMTFNWSFGNSSSSSSKNTSSKFTNIGLTDSIYKITLTGKTKHNCVESTKQSITVHPNPRADYSIKKSSGCAPFTIDDENISISSLQSPGTTFNWTVYDKRHNIINSYTGVKSQSYTIYKDADTVFIRLISTNTFGCKPDSSERMFTTIENPKAIFSVGIDKGCSPLGIKVINTSKPGNLKYSWYVDNIIKDTLKEPSFVFNNSDYVTNKLYNIKLLVIDNTSGCIDSMFKPITVYPIPKADFDFGTTNICSPAIVNVSNKSISVSNVKYKWDILKGSNVKISDSSAKEPVFEFPDNQSGYDSTYIVKLIVMSEENCTDTLEKSIKIYNRAKAIINIDSGLCTQEPLRPLNLSISAEKYFWTILPSKDVVISDRTEANPTIIFPKNTTGNNIQYIIGLIVISENGCKDSIERKFSLYSQPIISFTKNLDEGCPPLKVITQNTSSDPNVHSYYWKYYNGDTVSKQNDTILYLNNDTKDIIYPIKLFAISENSCTDSIQQFVTVHPNAEAFYHPTKLRGCAPFAISKENLNLKINSKANSIYNWTILDKDNKTIKQISDIDYSSYSIEKGEDTVYLRLVTTSKFNCLNDTFIERFTTIKNPHVSFNINDSAKCSPLKVNFSNNSTPIDLSYQWITNNTLLDTTKNPMLYFYNSSHSLNAIYKIKLVAIDGNTSCKDSVEKTLVVYPIPSPDFVASPVCYGEESMFKNHTVHGLAPIS